VDDFSLGHVGKRQRGKPERQYLTHTCI